MSCILKFETRWNYKGYKTTDNSVWFLIRSCLQCWQYSFIVLNFFFSFSFSPSLFVLSYLWYSSLLKLKATYTMFFFNFFKWCCMSKESFHNIIIFRKCSFSGTKNSLLYINPKYQRNTTERCWNRENKYQLHQTRFFL